MEAVLRGSMDISDAENLLRMQITMLDITANIKAIQHVLYERNITSQQALQQIVDGFRDGLSNSPQGQRLKELQNLLEQLKGTR
jgi:hypothetical protein